MARSSLHLSDVARYDADTQARMLLHDILKSVSRSFYLSLCVLPRSVREQVGVAYLFCRAADTIADTRILPRERRLHALNLFRQQFEREGPVDEQVTQLREQFVPCQGSDGERLLLHHLAGCFALYTRFLPADRQLIRELVGTLTQGMKMDLTYFPDADAQMVRALPDPAVLERYTYYVAGVVGAFWTKIHAAHLSSLQPHDVSRLCDLGIRFGKGLQMTNILKDVGRDLAIGRCYLPETHLRALHLTPEMLRQPQAHQRVRPLLLKLVEDTLTHLDCGYAYIELLPLRAIRLRLSCMWPLLFALQTLEVVCHSATLWEPQARVKISRQAVYRTMITSLGCTVSPRLLRRLYTRLHRRVRIILDRSKETLYG